MNIYIYSGPMRYGQLWAASFHYQKATQMIIRTEVHISSTGPHWGPLFPSLGS